MARPALYVFAALGMIAFLWAYWPTLVGLVQAWERQPDYSHGYFVVPLAIYFLWARRDTFPGLSAEYQAWPGIALMLFAAVMRYASATYYLGALDGWSIFFWVAGLFWVLGGWNWLRWALPSVVFLFFMVPLPYRLERGLSLPLQTIAARLSGWTLQCLGLPALTEGNIIFIGDRTLEVAEACSGLRIFVGIVALAYVYLVLARRSWWEKALLICSVIPISLIANATRIVLTGLLQQVSDDAAKKFSHDLAGWIMIPFAAALFALTLWYLGKLFPVRQQMSMRSLVRK